MNRKGLEPKGVTGVRELRTFFTVVLEPNIHTFSVLSETLPNFFKSKLLLNSANSLLNTEHAI